jgi:hypothetical protein
MNSETQATEVPSAGPLPSSGPPLEPAADQPETVIEPRSAWKALDLKELWRLII